MKSMVARVATVRNPSPGGPARAVRQPAEAGPVYVQPGNRALQHQILRSGAIRLTVTQPEDRYELTEGETVQRKRVAGGARDNPPSFASRVTGFRHEGQPLPQPLRSFFEPRFGRDFGRVRIHTGPAAEESARSLNARAYTLGSDVVFGAGEYAPGNAEGRRLLAHELAHVVQQETMAERRIMRATRNFALTFDDGPHTAALGTGRNRTERVLNTLQSEGIRAAFFIQTGVASRGANPVGRELVRRMHHEGHRIGIHTGGTTDHESHPSAQQAGRLESELRSAKEYIREQTGTRTGLVRPPYGQSDLEVRRTYSRLGLTNVLWDIDGDPGGNLSRAQLLTNVRDGIDAVSARGWRGTTAWAPRIVVLYHDIRAGTANHLGAVITEIRDKTRQVSGGADTAAFSVP